MCHTSLIILQFSPFFFFRKIEAWCKQWLWALGYSLLSCMWMGRVAWGCWFYQTRWAGRRICYESAFSMEVIEASNMATAVEPPSYVISTIDKVTFLMPSCIIACGHIHIHIQHISLIKSFIFECIRTPCSFSVVWTYLYILSLSAPLRVDLLMDETQKCINIQKSVR